MASVYMMGQLIGRLFNKEVDFQNDTIKLMLLTSSATPSVDIHVYIEDLEGEEITGTNYTQGGVTLSNKSITFDSDNNKVVFDADDVLWSSANFTTRYGVLYSEESSVIIGYIDFDEELNVDDTDFGINLNSQGFFVLSTKRYILDELDSVDNCVFGISYKRLTNSFRDEMVYVQRSSDNEKKWFGYDNNGDIESSLIESWVGAGNDGYVEQYMNQLNTNYPAYQTSFSAKPKIVENGSFLSDGLKFNGLSNFMNIDDYDDINIKNPSLSIYINKNLGEGYVFCLNQSSSLDVQYGVRVVGSTGVNIYMNGASRISKTIDLNSQFICTWSSVDINGLKIKYGISETSTTYNDILDSTQMFRIGCRWNSGGETGFGNGNIKSILIFNSDEYSNYTAITNAGI